MAKAGAKAKTRAKAKAPGRGRAYHHGDLARALVEESARLVRGGGPETFSLREAAEGCGVAVSAAYKHYASKGELLAAVADQGFAAMAEQMEATIAQAAAGQHGRRADEARLVAIGRAYVRYATAEPHLFRLMFGPLGPRGGRGDPRPDAPAHRLSRLLEDALQAVLRERGRPPEELAAAKLVSWALVHGFAMMVVDGVYDDPDEATREAIIEHLGQTILRSLR